MPSKSRKQQRFMGMLYNCKETGDCPDKDIKNKSKKIKKEDLRDFAGTKHKGLPEKTKRRKKSSIIADRLIALADNLDLMGLYKYSDEIDKSINSLSYSNNEEKRISCMPLDTWAGPPDNMMVYTHSSNNLSSNDFYKVINDGFRVSKSGNGSLEITFINEYINNIKSSLRGRVSEDNKHYNLGDTVFIAAIDPALMIDLGVDSDALKLAESEGPSILGISGIKNVRVFESWGDNHAWQKTAYKLPGRFLYAVYDGKSDRICINEKWNGSLGTEYGQKLVDNRKKYNIIYNDFFDNTKNENTIPYHGGSLDEYDEADMDIF